MLLYELLTGTTPLERAAAARGGATPRSSGGSARRSRRGRARGSASSATTCRRSRPQRKTEPARLTRLVRGELDWIVMKCLEKDRTRRYETANGLARDVRALPGRRAGGGVPALAGYRLRKFARKHRVGIATASAFAGLLITSVLISAMLAMTARQANVVAEKKRIEAEKNANEAEETGRKRRSISFYMRTRPSNKLMHCTT